MSPLISVVAPIYNEGPGVDRFITRLGEVLQGAGLRYELVLVDDGSSDDSWERIVTHARTDNRVRGIQLSRNFGKEPAVLAGLEHAAGDAVIVIDSDLQHPPTAIPAMVRAWRDGAHVVEAVKRNRTGQGLLGRLGGRVFNRAFTRLTKVDLVNATDFRLLSRPALDALLRLPEHSSFFRGTSSWIGFRRATLKVDIDDREDGVSRWTFRSLFRLAVNGLTSFTSAPLHLVTLGGLTFAVFSVVLGIQTLIRWISGDSVAGFPTVILLLLVMGTFILLGLGVIGEYLARIHEEVRGRPRYLIQERSAPPAQASAPTMDSAPAVGSGSPLASGPVLGSGSPVASGPALGSVSAVAAVSAAESSVPEQWVHGQRADGAESVRADGAESLRSNGAESLRSNGAESLRSNGAGSSGQVEHSGRVER